MIGHAGYKIDFWAEMQHKQCYRRAMPEKIYMTQRDRSNTLVTVRNYVIHKIIIQLKATFGEPKEKERLRCHGKYDKRKTYLVCEFSSCVSESPPTGQSEVWAYFEGHAVTLICVVHSFLIGFAHFGNKVLHRLTQDPEKR